MLFVQGPWETTVDELVRNFRSALVSLIPYLANIHLNYGLREGGYAWDEISEALYGNFVSEVIEYSLPEKEARVFSLNRYQFTYNNHVGTSFIEVLPLGTREEPEACDSMSPSYVFIYFDTVESPLDVVVCEWIDAGGNKLSEGGSRFPLDAVRFQLALKTPEGSIERISRLTVREYPV